MVFTAHLSVVSETQPLEILYHNFHYPLSISTKSLPLGSFRMLQASLKQRCLCINPKETFQQFPMAPCQPWLLPEGAAGILS